MDPSQLAPINPNDLGRGPLIMGVTWALTGVGIIVVGARLYIRWKKPCTLAWDDALIVAAMACQIVFQGVISESYQYGFGKRDENLTIEQQITIIKWLWISITPGVFVSILARISASLMLNRIFGRRIWFKWFLICFTLVCILAAIVNIIAVWIQASPIEAIWDPRVPATRRFGRIQNATANISQALFALSDLLYVLFPVVFIWKLNMTLRRKVGLCFIMSLSLISMVGSILKPVTADRAKTQYESSIVILWAGLEQALVIIISCVPSLHKVFQTEMLWLRKITSSIVNLVSLDRTGRGSTSAYSPSNRSRDPSSEAESLTQRKGLTPDELERSLETSDDTYAVHMRYIEDPHKANNRKMGV